MFYQVYDTYYKPVVMYWNNKHVWSKGIKLYRLHNGIRLYVCADVIYPTRNTPQGENLLQGIMR